MRLFGTFFSVSKYSKSKCLRDRKKYNKNDRLFIIPYIVDVNKNFAVKEKDAIIY